MQDAGWLDAVDVFNAAGVWKARVTYQGHLWLEVAENEGILKRMRDAVARSGFIGANTVLAAVVKEVIANAVCVRTPAHPTPLQKPTAIMTGR